MRFFSILALLSVSSVAAFDSVRVVPEEGPIDFEALEAEQAEIAAQELRKADTKVDALLAFREAKERELEELKSQVDTQIDTAFAPSLGACTDDANFKDKTGLGCKLYSQNKNWCSDATKYTNSAGKSAKEACCVCGGGNSGIEKGTYYIKSLYSGEYIGIYKITSPHVRMSDNLWSPYIDIDIVPLTNNEFALVSHRYGNKYISVNEDGTIRSYHVLGEWERFKIIELNNGTVQFYNVKWGKYLDIYNNKIQTSLKPLGKYTSFNLLPAKSMHTELDATQSIKRKNLRA